MLAVISWPSFLPFAVLLKSPRRSGPERSGDQLGMYRLIRSLAPIPIAATITRSYLALRPCTPMSLPTSLGATEYRRTIVPAP